ncbi:ComEA family DNA-binding protein [Leptobacterium sp. I13]|uniref:ComEA family DNA-binding protein n=1 Tax=Leptobacterium meishanense TaxID=3128904 RepID=UPI0030EC3638
MIVNEKELTVLNNQVDSLKKEVEENKKIKIYPFNANYLNDYRGYILGMDEQEIDRFLKYRKTGKQVYTLEEFQKITKASDSLMNNIKPYLNFPGQNKKSIAPNLNKKILTTLPKKDLNTATAEELKAINGIGKTLSKRIVKYRDLLYGFSEESQLKEVYGLAPEVVEKLLEKYTILSPPNIKKVNINTASLNELAAIPYVNYKQAKDIISYRTKHGQIESIKELTKIQDFPTEKINRIELYLTTK